MFTFDRFDIVNKLTESARSLATQNLILHQPIALVLQKISFYRNWAHASNIKSQLTSYQARSYYKNLILQVMVTVSDIAANNVTLRKVNSAGLHSVEEMHPMASMSAPAVNALGEAIASNAEELEIMERRKKAEELRHKEILFKIERYAISLFAIFFLVFNAVYWTDLLYSAKFSER